jgi:Protein kinase domain
MNTMKLTNADCFALPFFSRLFQSLSWNEAKKNCLYSSYYDDNDENDNAPCKSSPHDSYTSITDFTLTEGYDSTEEDDHVEIAKVSGLDDLHRRRFLGSGQFGQVWLVTDQRNLLSNTAYALKAVSKYDLITADEVHSIVSEKEIMQQLSFHPFIAQLHASFQNETHLFLLQEFCQGGELFSLMHPPSAPVDHCLPESQACFYTLCIADALEYMHVQHSIVYRDLKPENVMLDGKGYPKLIDMGYAKRLRPEEDYISFTFCGTPRYVAPEMIAAQGSSFGVDHWALGILLHEMMLGQNPFFTEDMDQMELFESICHDEIGVLPERCSTDVSSLIVSLLTKGPDHRIGLTITGRGRSICRHPTFSHFDLVAMKRKQIRAPWVPQLKDDLNAELFDDFNDDVADFMFQDHPKLTRREAALFESY